MPDLVKKIQEAEDYASLGAASSEQIAAAEKALHLAFAPDYNGKDRQRHQREGQEGARAAVREEHGIPVADVGEDRACCDGVYEDQAQTLFESTLFLFD